MDKLFPDIQDIHIDQPFPEIHKDKSSPDIYKNLLFSDIHMDKLFLANNMSLKNAYRGGLSQFERKNLSWEA